MGYGEIIGASQRVDSYDLLRARILGDRIVPGDVVLIRYEGPRGGPGMQEMLYPTSYLKSKGLGKVCALVTDSRFSGGSSGLCIGHISPEAAEDDALALVEEGDTIEIDIPKRILRVNLSDKELASVARQWRPGVHLHGSPQPVPARSRRPSRPTPPSPPAPPAAPSAAFPASRSRVISTGGSEASC